MILQRMWLAAMVTVQLFASASTSSSGSGGDLRDFLSDERAAIVARKAIAEGLPHQRLMDLHFSNRLPFYYRYDVFASLDSEKALVVSTAIFRPKPKVVVNVAALEDSLQSESLSSSDDVSSIALGSVIINPDENGPIFRSLISGCAYQFLDMERLSRPERLLDIFRCYKKFMGGVLEPSVEYWEYGFLGPEAYPDTLLSIVRRDAFTRFNDPVLALKAIMGLSRKEYKKQWQECMMQAVERKHAALVAILTAHTEHPLYK